MEMWSKQNRKDINEIDEEQMNRIDERKMKNNIIDIRWGDWGGGSEIFNLTHKKRTLYPT